MPSEKHRTLPDREFEEQFAQGTLPKTLFTHEAHLRLAWLHVTQYGAEQAAANISRQIQDFVAKIGATDKYHHTVTIAAVKAVHHSVQRSRSDNFPDFIAEFPRLKTNFKDLLAAHYSFDLFQSEKARKTYLAPDLLPFS